MEKCPFYGKSLPDKTNSNNNVKRINKNPMKKCPFCAETIKAEAIVCRYCGRDLTEEFTKLRFMQDRIVFFVIWIVSISIISGLFAYFFISC